MVWLGNSVLAHVSLSGKVHVGFLGATGVRESHFNCKAENPNSMKKREPLSTEMSSLVLTKILMFQLDFSGSYFAVPR